MSCYIYVIGRENGPIKIGVSKNPYSRVDTIQTGCPFPIKVFHAEEMRCREHALWHERNFKEFYKRFRLVGEWFNMKAREAIYCVEEQLEFEYHRERKEELAEAKALGEIVQ